MLHTIWAKPVYLGLIRPQEMVPVTHVLGLLVFSKLQAFFCISFRIGFLLGWWPCRPIWYSVRSMAQAPTGWPPTSSTSAAMLVMLKHLLFWSQPLEAKLNTGTQLFWSTLVQHKWHKCTELFSEDNKAVLLYSSVHSFYTCTCSQCTVISKFHFGVVEATCPVSEVLSCKYVPLTHCLLWCFST